MEGIVVVLSASLFGALCIIIWLCSRLLSKTLQVTPMGDVENRGHLQATAPPDLSLLDLDPSPRQDRQSDKVVQEPSQEPIQDPDGFYRTGTKVVIDGLMANAENNSTVAEVIRYDQDMAKYLVRTMASKRKVKLKPENVFAWSSKEGLRPDAEEAEMLLQPQTMAEKPATLEAKSPSWTPTGAEKADMVPESQEPERKCSPEEAVEARASEILGQWASPRLHTGKSNRLLEPQKVAGKAATSETTEAVAAGSAEAVASAAIGAVAVATPVSVVTDLA
jgi:hypothetical protein